MQKSNDNLVVAAPHFALNATELRTAPADLAAHIFHTHARTIATYAIAGASGTAAHFAILFVALDAIGAVAASTLGAISGCVINFVLAHRFVFPGQSDVRRSFPRFVSVASLGFMLNAVILKALLVSLPVFWCQVVATCTVFLFTYAFNRGWTFHER